MTDDRSLERAARSWLETGPTEAPDRAVAAALLQIETTAQERDLHVPWRTRPMTQTTRLLAGAAAFAVVFVGGALLLRPGHDSGVGQASPSAPAASLRPSAVARLDTTFTSNRYGYTVEYPSGWTTAGSTRPWTTDVPSDPSGRVADELSGTGVRFSGAAQPIATGQTADQWIREFGSPVGALAGQGGGPANWPIVSIDGVAGWIDVVDAVAPAGGITPGGRVFDAIVVSGGYGYNFTMDGNVDRATFEALLATVTLPTIPVLDRTFASPLGGYTMQRPNDWSATPATKSWTAGYETQSVSDEIGATPSIYGTSMKLSAGTTFDTWFAGYDADRVLGTRCGAPSSNEDITIDGALGHLDVHCPADYLEAVVPKGGRVYVFTMFKPFSRPLFETLVGSVHLMPATAKN